MVPAESGDGDFWVRIGGGVVGLLTVFGMAWRALQGLTKHEEENKPAATHMVMEAASLADLRPMLDRVDKVQLSLDSQHLTLKTISVTQSEILAEMRLQAKEERDRRDSEERDELLELRFEQRVKAAMDALGSKERERDKTRDR